MIEVEIKIKTKDGKEFTLDNEDAKKLFEELKVLYQKEKETVYIPYGVREIQPVIYPSQPYWIYKNNNGTSYSINYKSSV